MKNGYSITIVVPENLTSYTDTYLVSLWHLSQINPAKFGDPEACRFAELVGREIIRRFIAIIAPELWNHQGANIGFEQKIKEGVPEKGKES